MNRSVLTGALAVLAAVLAFWGSWEHIERKRLKRELAVARQECQVLSAAAAAAKSDAAMARVAPTATAGNEPPKAVTITIDGGETSLDPKAGDPLAAFGKLLADPEMKEFIKAQSRTELDPKFDDLFDLLGLDDAQRSALEKILAERAENQLDAGLELIGRNLSEAEKKAAADELARANESFDARIKAELGDEKFELFQRYEESEGERAQMKAYAGLLRESGQELSETAETQLMSMMFEERKRFKFDTDLSDSDEVDPSKLTEVTVARYGEQSDELRARILDRASAILTPEQVEVLRRAQSQQAAMERAGLRMALGLLGKKE